MTVSVLSNFRRQDWSCQVRLFTLDDINQPARSMACSMQSKGSKPIIAFKHYSQSITSHCIRKYSRQSVEFKLFKPFQPCSATHALRADSHPKKRAADSIVPCRYSKYVQRIQAAEEEKRKKMSGYTPTWPVHLCIVPLFLSNPFC